MIPTSREKLRIAVPTPPSKGDLNELISKLKHIVRNNHADEVIPTLQRIIHNFKSPSYIQTPQTISMTNKIRVNGGEGTAQIRKVKSFQPNPH